MSEDNQTTKTKEQTNMHRKTRQEARALRKDIRERKYGASWNRRGQRKPGNG